MVLNFGTCAVCGKETTNGVCDFCGYGAICCVCGRIRQHDGTWGRFETESKNLSHTFCPYHTFIERVKIKMYRIKKLFTGMAVKQCGH